MIASDVGALKESVVPGETGFVCRPGDAGSLAESMEEYFSSELFEDLEQRRPRIQAWVEENHSWQRIAEQTVATYEELVPKHEALHQRQN